MKKLNLIIATFLLFTSTTFALSLKQNAGNKSQAAPKAAPKTATPQKKAPSAKKTPEDQSKKSTPPAVKN